ncbi:MAG: hypothetical protein JWM82_3403 [Myxococcales bacterium]|nr:hypothetical protein [Myxococcales bacterium]
MIVGGLGCQGYRCGSKATFAARSARTAIVTGGFGTTAARAPAQFFAGAGASLAGAAAAPSSFLSSSLASSFLPASFMNQLLSVAF